MTTMNQQEQQASSSSSTTTTLTTPTTNDVKFSDQRPSAHVQRYDRQLRLWASSGQTSLETAKIAVISATYIGASILKNVILPGIGGFDLIDERNIDELDVGSNFFIQHSDKGKSRSQEVVRNLCELNPSVKGKATHSSASAWLEKVNIDDYNIIVAVDQPNDILFPLADRAWQARNGLGVPLMSVKSFGLVGQIDIQIREIGIIESHPESTVDLRLLSPWQELQNFTKTFDLATEDTLVRSHIPYIVILLRKLQDWRNAHQGANPQPAKHRKEFIESINQIRQGSDADQENIDEALAALGQHVWRPISQRGTINDEIQALLNDEQVRSTMTTKQGATSNFWLLVRALKRFVEHGDGTLPLSGSLPDMKAQSSTYVSLQRIYKAKAAADVKALQSHLHDILQENSLPTDAISLDEVESFAKHAAFLKLIRGKNLREKLENPNGNAIETAFQEMVNPITIPTFFAINAAETFAQRHRGRYPGTTLALSKHVAGHHYSCGDDDRDDMEEIRTSYSEEDENELKQIAAELAKRISITDEEYHGLIEKACSEVCRSGHSDTPSTAALFGGIAAQEIIKIITHQYVPFDNVVLYDGIKQAIGVFQL